MDGETIIKFKYESASAVLKRRDGLYWLERVYARQRGLGHGSGLMQVVAEYIIDNKLEVLLKVRPYDSVVNKGILNSGQLVEFYEKFGWVRLYPKAKEIIMYSNMWMGL